MTASEVAEMHDRFHAVLTIQTRTLSAQGFQRAQTARAYCGQEAVARHEHARDDPVGCFCWPSSGVEIGDLSSQGMPWLQKG